MKPILPRAGRILAEEKAYDLYNNFYWSDSVHYANWVLPPKVASTSLRSTFRPGNFMRRDRMLELNTEYFTIGVLRHPMDRAYCALRTLGDRYFGDTDNDKPFRERLLKWRDDSHVRPLWRMFEGIRVDYWLRFEHLDEDWAGLQAAHDEAKAKAGLPPMLGKTRYPEKLPHLNGSGLEPGRWQDACDWSEFMPMYEKDFQLNVEWERP